MVDPNAATGDIFGISVAISRETMLSLSFMMMKGLD
ncbi:MAG: hypothetical protein IPO26_19505 [Saprospiraceae bacterium]|nr:hypothetical protein [Saprospiraceae bacterium]